MEQECAFFWMEVAAEPGKLTLIRRFQVRPFRLPAEEYEPFPSFLAQVAKADKTMAVLVGK